MTPEQIKAAAAVTEILLEREDPAIHGLQFTASPISMEIGWNDVLAVKLHAVKADGHEATVQVDIAADGETFWWLRTADEVSVMPLPYAATVMHDYARLAARGV